MSAAARPNVAVIGAGPAGLMAAETLAAGGAAVTVFEQTPSPARKFLMAGRGGLNLTNSEPFEDFLARYGDASARLRPALARFDPAAMGAWARSLGQDVFVGSSGRVFPVAMKASPLLRAWLARLRAQGVTLKTRRVWRGWDAIGELRIEKADGAAEAIAVEATVLAVGGASWPRLGSDGAWVERLAAVGVVASPLRPANCGFDAAWSPHLRERFAGAALKTLALTFGDLRVRGEVTITVHGLEGGAVYALAAPLREAIAARGSAQVEIDLRPDLSEADLAVRLTAAASARSLSNRLRQATGLAPAAIGLLREPAGVLPSDARALARRIKATPVTLVAPRPLARAISTAGGVRLDDIGGDYGLLAAPGVFVAGEMLDWEAPTGGYLLQACFATGAAAARGALAYVGRCGP